MNKSKFFISLFLAVSMLVVQVGGVFAAPALQVPTPITGTVQSITLETDPNTGITTVLVDVLGKNQVLQTIRVSQEIAIKPLGLITLNGDGNPMINDLALGEPIEIDPTAIIPDKEENQHPVGSALATFFSDIAGMDYEKIMAAHDQGIGFGVIAQTLWLTAKLKGNSEVFRLILDAKKTGDYSAFILADGTTPKNWGQLRKAIMDSDEKNNLGIVMSSTDEDNNSNGNNQDEDKNKDKDKDKNKDKGKDKNKDKDQNNKGNDNGNGKKK